MCFRGRYMMLTDVPFGLGRALRLGTVGISLLLSEGTVIVGAEGLIGMAAMLWWRYQAKTVRKWGVVGEYGGSLRVGGKDMNCAGRGRAEEGVDLAFRCACSVYPW